MAKAQPISDVAADTPLGAFAARVIEVRAGEVRGLLSGTQNGGPEGVHDRRVAIRRLRTAIEVFGPALPKRSRAVRRELKEAFDALGPRRDADVAIEALQAMAPELEPEDTPGLDGLIAAFDAQGGASAAPLDPAAVLRCGDEAVALAERARSDGGPPAAAELRRVAARRMAAVQRRLPALERPRDAEALHDLRIAAKRLRYVLESAAPALGQPALDGAAVARELQTVLGDLHDCDVMLPRVRAHRRELRAADVAAVRRGESPPHADRYRGIQAVDTRLRARREELRDEAVAARADVEARLRRSAAEMGLDA